MQDAVMSLGFHCVSVTPLDSDNRFHECNILRIFSRLARPFWRGAPVPSVGWYGDIPSFTSESRSQT